MLDATSHQPLPCLHSLHLPFSLTQAWLIFLRRFRRNAGSLFGELCTWDRFSPRNCSGRQPLTPTPNSIPATKRKSQEICWLEVDGCLGSGPRRNVTPAPFELAAFLMKRQKCWSRFEVWFRLKNSGWPNPVLQRWGCSNSSYRAKE